MGTTPTPVPATPTPINLKLVVFINSSVTACAPSGPNATGAPTFPLPGPGTLTSAALPFTPFAPNVPKYRATGYQWLYSVPIPGQGTPIWFAWGAPSLSINTQLFTPQTLLVDIIDLNPAIGSYGCKVAMNQFGILIVPGTGQALPFQNGNWPMLLSSTFPSAGSNFPSNNYTTPTGASGLLLMADTTNPDFPPMPSYLSLSAGYSYTPKTPDTINVTGSSWGQYANCAWPVLLLNFESDLPSTVQLRIATFIGVTFTPYEMYVNVPTQQSIFINDPEMILDTNITS